MTKDRGPRQAEDGLEAYFAAARDDVTAPEPALLRRIADAGRAEQARWQRSPEPRGLLAGMRAALGGWRGLSGLAAACAAGLWIGWSGPAALPFLPDLATGSVIALDLDPLSGFDLALLEE